MMPWALLGALALAALSPRPAHAVAIKRVMDIKVGDRGYCLTVFRGLKPEKFRIQVQGIMFNYFPRQHLILITSDDPKVKRSGIVAGMSGSPCYIDNKLVGALAYGPNWTKRPVAMLTPISVMLHELKRPLRGMRFSPLALHRRHRQKPRPAALRTATRQLAWASPKNPLAPWQRLLPAPLSARVRRGVAGMRRLSVPLSVSGLDAMTLKELKKSLAPYGMQVVQGGASSRDALKYYPHPNHFVNGGSIGVQLMRGAVSMNGTGTVTYVQGKRVLAFGHPMANWGEHYIPVTAAWIHMFMPSYSSSYKISSPLNELGSLVMDRRPCIMAQSGLKAPMIPVSVKVSSKAGGTKNYDFEVFSNYQATPVYIAYAIRSILRKEVSDVWDTTVSARVSFDTDGAGSFSLNDYFFTRRGAGLGFHLAYTRGFRVLSFLMQSPLGRVRLKRMRVEVKVDHHARVADIEKVTVPRASVVPGGSLLIRVTLKRRYGGGRYEKDVRVRIPRHVPAGSLIRIEVAAGPYAKVDAAPVENLADVRRLVSRLYNARQLVIRVMQPGEGTSVHGRIVSNLPGSVLDSLRTGTTVKTRIVQRTSVRKVLRLDDVISGLKRFYVQVEDPTP